MHPCLFPTVFPTLFPPYGRTYTCASATYRRRATHASLLSPARAAQGGMGTFYVIDLTRHTLTLILWPARQRPQRMPARRPPRSSAPQAPPRQGAAAPPPRPPPPPWRGPRRLRPPKQLPPAPPPGPAAAMPARYLFTLRSIVRAYPPETWGLCSTCKPQYGFACCSF